VLSLVAVHFALPPDPNRLRTGERLGNFTLEEPLGAGGMGVVYRAQQHIGPARRPVAVKLVHPALLLTTREEALARFMAELHTLVTLQHAHIARIYDGGLYEDSHTHEQLPYIAMELVRGGEVLTAYSTTHALPITERLALILQVCRAVQYAHEHRILHRDLKPANILVDTEGHPFVIDFGLARAYDELVPGAALVSAGTPAYMSPEQVTEGFGALSAKTDVYALGLILYEVLTGQLPYHLPPGGTFEELCQMITAAVPRPLGEYDAAYQGELEAIVAAALAKRPIDRLPLTVLRSRLERYLQGLPPDGGRLWHAFAHNLPQHVTSFIGRQQEMADIQHQLATTRLLNLTGPGGTGKTRLALQVGAEVLEAYGDGVWWVELAALSDAGLIPQTVAAVFGLREESRRTMQQTLTTYLQPKSMLLILDNCEHLIEDCARLVETLLYQCPHLRIMTTSRETLGMPGETVWRVPSLSLPDQAQMVTLTSGPSALTQYEAIHLFVERATSNFPAFAITSRNAPAVVQVCTRLDGIPLAIELAAAWVKSLTVDQIAARLDDRFRLLTRGSRTALPRQQTLSALLDWSYDLLTQSERTLLICLSVFAAGWTLEAAEAVCAGAGNIASADVPHLLLQLVDKSLVLYEEHNGLGRYRLLETVREYSRNKLYAAGLMEAMYDRHLAYFLAFAEEVAPKLQGPQQTEWYELLEMEYDNLRGALEWAHNKRDDAVEVSPSANTVLRIVKALQLFWCLRGYFAEGQNWVSRGSANWRKSCSDVCAE
jgi:non-specific serine/threonine protein kinase